MDRTDPTGAAPASPPVSPMIAQLKEIKAAHPDALLFFRMGDFYELFFADAVAAAGALDIALTKRGKHEGQDIPMCGVPAHNAEPYLQRLIKKGFKVAICEQLEDPAVARKRPGRSLVRRDVVRIVTPGTITEDGLLEPRRNNYLAAVARSEGRLGVAWADLSTGEVASEATDPDGLPSVVARLDPGEVVVSERLVHEPSVGGALRGVAERVSPLRDQAFESVAAARRLQGFYGVATLEALGAFTRAEIAALGGLLDYLDLTQKGTLPRLERPRRIEPEGTLRLDPATRRSLELTVSLTGVRSGSLLAVIDRTLTGAGARLLAARLAAPLAEPAAIRARLDEVEAMLADEACRQTVRAGLRRCPDIERAMARLGLGRGGPRDLKAIEVGLVVAARLRDQLGDAPAPLRGLGLAVPDLATLIEALAATLIDEPPFLARDGGAVRPGASAELDEARQLRDQARRHVAALEARYREATGITSLKIRHNGMLGHYVEVSAAHRARVPEGFVQRQSMAGATRYTTGELAELESRIANAAERALELELAILDELSREVLAKAAEIGTTAATLATLDVTAGLAELAHARRWVRPTIDDSEAVAIEGGRHPVVEEALERERQPFVANDCRLEGSGRLWLLTGPNMAGKSTFLRQTALIVILAQMGSFVPAAAARIGVVDRLFSRVGAADDLARGRSTFMVEMVETATILNQAGPKSFVILDEIGRGTATFDGLSIAWAVIEHLHEVNRCRGLFATHFHELTALAARLKGLQAWTMRVKEWQGEVVFLHEVGQGSADRSYGIHVAKLAGLPKAVVARAEAVLARLEEGEARSAPARLADDLPLFAAVLERPSPQPAAGPAGDGISALLADIDPDGLSPRAALDVVFRLKALLAGAGSG